MLRNPIADFASITLPVAVLVLLRLASPALSPTAIDVMVKDHRFSTSEIHVPAGKAITLNITNDDPLTEEFDSTALKIEKVIDAGEVGVVHIQPLDQGRYPFMGKYHSDTAQGALIVE